MIDQSVLDELKQIFEGEVYIEPPLYYNVIDEDDEVVGTIERMFDGRWQLRVDGAYRCTIG